MTDARSGASARGKSLTKTDEIEKRIFADEKYVVIPAKCSFSFRELSIYEGCHLKCARRVLGLTPLLAEKSVGHVTRVSSFLVFESRRIFFQYCGQVIKYQVVQVLDLDFRSRILKNSFAELKWDFARIRFL